MSYTNNLKTELCHVSNTRTCCRIAELAAIARSAGELNLLGGGSVNMVISTESEAVAARVCALCMDAGYDKPELIMVMRSQPRKMRVFTVTLSNKQLLDKLGIGVISTPLSDFCTDCCCAAVLRGAFLGSGMLSDPNKQYCAEFSLVSESSAEAICNILTQNGIECKWLTRADREIISVRDGDGIVRLMGIMGASAMLLELENVRVIKNVRNKINRQNNCDTANIGKTVDASVRQCSAIRALAKAGRLRKMSEPLREMATLRLDNPEATLNELARELGISRSAVNNRLRALCKAAEDLL